VQILLRVILKSIISQERMYGIQARDEKVVQKGVSVLCKLQMAPWSLPPFYLLSCKPDHEA